MDSFNWMVCELLTMEAARARLNGQQKAEPEAPTRPSLLRRTLASSLVRLGLRLDPAVGEGLGALELPLVATEGGVKA
jgi:hypothetical protein